MAKIMILDHSHCIESIVNIVQKDKASIVAKSSHLNSALEILPKAAPDIIIIEFNFIRSNILTHIKTLNRLAPNSKLLISHCTFVDLTSQITDLISGLISKPYLKEELNLAIGALKQGQLFLSPYFTREFITKKYCTEDHFGCKPQQGNTISERELEVLQLILKEYSNQEIAEALYISRRTVEVHKRNLLIKTNTKNIVGLILYGLNNGLLKSAK